MKPESLTAIADVGVPESHVFAILANPFTHAAIDGTGWVREPVDGDLLDHVGQVFRMGVYHENHPDKHYEMANRVEVLDEPSAISWQPGQFSADTGELELGGWTWRYDLAPAGSDVTKVTLTYDWSAVTAEIRDEIQFPPFEHQHLDNSLKHLTQLATRPG